MNYIYAKLETENGKPVKNAKVQFQYKGKTYNKQTNNKGVARIPCKSYRRGTFSVNFDGMTLKQNQKEEISLLKTKKQNARYDSRPLITMTAKPSCSCGQHSSYTWRTKSFVNYCPNCHRWGTLRCNPKGIFEGEYTCVACDSDFCGNCGKEKMGYSHKYLIPAHL